MNVGKVIDTTLRNQASMPGLLGGIGKAYNMLVPDKTDENIISDLDRERQIAREEQERLWAREDEIRKETQAREDSAYTRAVEDARKAGINPNLINLAPAASGGGISNATAQDYTLQGAEYERQTQKSLAEYERETKMIMQQIEQQFEMDQREKDRMARSVQSLLMMGKIAFIG